MSIIALPGIVALFLIVAMLLAAGFAFVDAVSHRPDAYVAADKLTKKAWMIILGLGMAVQLVFMSSGPISLLHLVSIIAAIVYLVDVRPALRSLEQGSGRY